MAEGKRRDAELLREEAEDEREENAQQALAEMAALAAVYKEMLGSSNAPTVQLTSINGGIRLTVTDTSGSKSMDILNGISATHSWDGTTLTVTSASGTSSKDLKGEKGDTGKQGRGISGVAKTSSSGGVDTYTITMTDNSTFTFSITNGKDGNDGVGVSKVEKTATKGNVDTYTISLTNGTTFNFNVTNGIDGKDGTSVTHSWNGTRLTVTSASGSSTADLKGEKGDKGDTGEGFRIAKTYSSIEEMNAAFSTDGLPLNSFVMINTGNVEDNDNSKLFVKTASGYSYLSDLSGAQGIQGEQGKQGDRGPAGYGISKIEKTGSSGLVDTYRITLEDGNSYSYSITNGKDGASGVGVSKVEKTATSNNVDTYTITLTNGTTFNFNVTNGVDGIHGVSATHSWDGTVLTVASASGISSADLKGDKGDQGDKGDAGEGYEIVYTTGKSDGTTYESVYNVTVQSITATMKSEIPIGTMFVMVPHAPNQSYAQLSVNGLAKVSMRRARRGNYYLGAEGLTQGKLSRGYPYRVMFTGEYWDVLDHPIISGDDLYDRVPVDLGGVPFSSANENGEVLQVVDGTPKWGKLDVTEEVTIANSTAVYPAVFQVVNSKGGYYVEVPGVSELTAGMRITIIPDTTSFTTSPYLILNNGVRYIIGRRSPRYSDVNYGLEEGGLRAGIPITLMFTGTAWVVESMPYVSAVGGGSGSGDEIVTTEGSGSSYTASVDGITELKPGISFVMIPHVDSDAYYPDLNVNGLGVKGIARYANDNMHILSGGDTKNWLKQGIPVKLMYIGSYWIAVDLPKIRGVLPDTTETFDGQSLNIINGVPTWFDRDAPILATFSGSDNNESTYEVNVPWLYAPTAGTNLVIIPVIDNPAGFVNLNVNGVVNRLERPWSWHTGENTSTFTGAGTIKANKPYRIMFNGSTWVLSENTLVHASAIMGGRLSVSYGGVPEPTENGKVLAVGGGVPYWADFSADAIVDVTTLPKENINEKALYRYTESKKKFYAVTTTSRNVVEYEGRTMTVEVKDVETLPSYSSAEAVTNLTNKITLYYQYSDGKVYGAINNIILMGALKVSKQGWYEPTYAIKNYAGVIDSVLDAEYGYVYVVREIETKIHILYYKNGAWHETIDDYIPRLGDVSKEKFVNSPNENVNVSGYRSISNDYDRVYVESAGNSGVSGDYCLTPDAEILPTDPWTAASEDKVVHLPSIPVRDVNGGISVYTDENSTPDKAVSKRYFNRNTVQYVRRKPEESSAVANAKLVSAHTWTPDNSLYANYGETFDGVTEIPAVANVTQKDLIAIFDESNANNSIGISDDNGNNVVNCNHPTSAQSKYRFIRRGTENELVLSFDIKIAPASGLTNNRGFTMVAKNDLTADTSMWGGSNLSVEYPKGGTGYQLTFLSTTIPFGDYVGDWVNLRIEMDGLGKGSPARLYLNNELKISSTITASVASIKAYDFMIYNWNNSNSGFRGNIYFDNMYFGDIPDTVRYSGYDTLTPIAYDYEDNSVQMLGLDTLVTRKPDGTLLTKKEPTVSDDERIAVSKYYLDSKISDLIKRINTLEAKINGNGSTD